MPRCFFLLSTQVLIKLSNIKPMKATQIPSVSPIPAPFLSDKAFKIYCHRSSVPIKAPIITINNANTMVWFKPSII